MLTSLHLEKRGRNTFKKRANWPTLWTSLWPEEDRKSTRLNSSHSQISYAVFCLKKKKTHIAARIRLLLAPGVMHIERASSLATLLQRRLTPLVIRLLRIIHVDALNVFRLRTNSS